MYALILSEIQILQIIRKKGEGKFREMKKKQRSHFEIREKLGGGVGDFEKDSVLQMRKNDENQVQEE